MTDVNPKLLADLARLAARYPPEDWEVLARRLEDERLRAQVSALLQELAATSRTRRSVRPKRPPVSSRAARLQTAIGEIRASDGERARVLEDVWTRLRTRELLPTMRSVRVFAESSGLKGLNATKREQAVTEIMEQLVEMKSSDLMELLSRPAVEERGLGEEYERWARLILRQRGADEGGAARSSR